MDNSVPQIKKVNVSQQTFEYILNMIMKGEWKQGQKLPSENDFKDMLGVSRHTVRSALNNLNMLGIVETIHGDGNYVKATGIGLYMDFLIPYLFVSNRDIATILEFREGIEMTTAHYASLRATDEDIIKLREKLDICKKYATDVQNYLTADFDFHYQIAEISRNELLIQSMYVVKKYCFASLAEYLTKDISFDGTVWHEKIFTAIKNGDPDLSSKLMNDHIKSIIKRIKTD